MNKKNSLVLLAALALTASACGGGDGESGGGDSVDSGPCPSELFTGTISRADDVNGGHTAADYVGEDFKFGTAELKGEEYVIYLSDADVLDSFSPSPEPGGVVVSFGYKPDAVDVEGAMLEEWGRMPHVDNAGSSSHSIGSPNDDTANIELIENTETYLCFDVFFTTDDMQLDGTVSVPKVVPAAE